jgi:hypothetical protein
MPAVQPFPLPHILAARGAAAAYLLPGSCQILLHHAELLSSFLLSLGALPTLDMFAPLLVHTVQGQLQLQDLWHKAGDSWELEGSSFLAYNTTAQTQRRSTGGQVVGWGYARE